MNTTQQFNVWDSKYFYEKNGKFPEMSDEDKKTFLEFAEIEVENSIESYERYTYNHGGLDEEAKERMATIATAEKLRNQFKKELEN